MLLLLSSSQSASESAYGIGWIRGWSYSCNDKPRGNIETGFKLFDKPQKCISRSCVSSADSKIPKRAEGTKLPLWPGDKTYE